MNAERANKWAGWLGAAAALICAGVIFWIVMREPQQILTRERHLCWWIVAFCSGLAALLGWTAAALCSQSRKAGWRWVLPVITSVVAPLIAAPTGAFAVLLYAFVPHVVRPDLVTQTAGLASVPAAAMDVKAVDYGRPGDYRMDWLMFRATPDDVETFLRKSQALIRPPFAVYDSNNTFMPYGLSQEEIYERYPRQEARAWAFFDLTPEWFKPEITVLGRQFDFQNGKRWGTAIVDDDKNIVYVYLAWH